MYPVIYNRKGQIYEMSDIAEMLDLAIAMQIEYPAMTEVTILVPTQDSVNSWLDCVQGISCSPTSFTYKSLSGRIKTPRTYKSKNIQNSEIVIAPCALQSNLEKIQDSKSIAAVLVIPEMVNQCDRWLMLHSATNYQTQSEYPNTLSVTALENRVIGYLKHESVMFAPLSHRSMEYYIQRMANILRKNNVTSTYEAIYKLALQRGLSHKDADIVSSIIGSNKTYSFSTAVNYDPIFEDLNQEKWETN